MSVLLPKVSEQSSFGAEVFIPQRTVKVSRAPAPFLSRVKRGQSSPMFPSGGCRQHSRSAGGKQHNHDFMPQKEL